MSTKPVPPAVPTRRDLLKYAAAAGALTLLPRAAHAIESAQTTQPKRPAPAPQQGAGFYRFMLGDFEVALMADGGMMAPPSFVLPTAEDVELQAILRQRFLPEAGPIPLPVNALLVRTPDKTVLVDTGGGPAYSPAAGRLHKHLANLGVTPEEIDLVLITHLHPDHFGGALDEHGAPAFPNAEYLVSEPERAFWAGEPDFSESLTPEQMRGGMVAGAKATLAALDERLRAIQPNEEITTGVRAVDAAGHTPGHVGVHLASGEAELLFWTDLVHMAPLQLARPDWQVAFDVDPNAAAATRKRILDQVATDRLLVAGSHVPFPALAHVARHGSGYVWDPIMWEWR